MQETFFGHNYFYFTFYFTFWKVHQIAPLFTTTLITLTMSRAQASHLGSESKGIIYSFRYKGVYLRVNIKVLLL